MPTAEENSPPYTDADYYGFFMTGLFGLVDDAELAGYSPNGTELLRQAQKHFWAEFRDRHREAWTENVAQPDGS